MVCGVSWKSGEGELGMQHECNSSKRKHMYPSWEREEHWEPQTNPDQSFHFFFFFFDSAVKYPSKLDFNLSYFQLTPQSDQYSMAHNHELCVLMRAVLVGGFI